MMQDIYSISVESMPRTYKKALVFNFNCSVWMNKFCRTICCIYVQLNMERCETHGIVTILII